MKIKNSRSCKWTLCAFFILWGVLARAQENQDYVVNYMNVKIYGKITKYNEGSVKISPADGGKAQKFKPGDATEYYVAGKDLHYVSLSNPKESGSGQTFQRRLAYGTIELFSATYKRAAPMGGMGGAGYGAQMAFGVGLSSASRLYARKGSYDNLVELNSSRMFKASKEKRKERLLELIGDDTELAARLLAEEEFKSDMIVQYVKEYNQRRVENIKTN